MTQPDPRPDIIEVPTKMEVEELYCAVVTRQVLRGDRQILQQETVSPYYQEQGGLLRWFDQFGAEFPDANPIKIVRL